MPDPLYPMLNGVRFDWSSVEIKINGKPPIIGVKALSYKHTLDPGEVFGTSAQLLGRTRGQYKAEGSIELYKAEYHLLIAYLGNGYLEKSFEITTHYDEAGLVLTDNLKGVRLKGADNSHQQGNEALTVKSDLSIMYLIENGVAPLSKLRR